jgi:hypothetical protein
MSRPLDLDGIDPDTLIDVTAFVARRAATDFVLIHHLANALGIPSRWYLDTACLAHDLAHELSPLDPTRKETP